ncbi:MAG: MerR family transcriptional regulator [Actinoallomurus sp.]
MHRERQRHPGEHIQRPIAELVAVWESGACADVKADLRPRVAARLEEAACRIAELTAFAASLRRALAHLDVLPDRAGRCDPECGLLGSAALTAPVTVELAPRPEQENERWRNAPVACSLSGEHLTERAAQWRQLLDGAEPEQIDDGLRLTLPAERAAAMAALAAEEQRCCPFFDFRLHLDGPVVHLQVCVPAEGASLLAELFASA